MRKIRYTEKRSAIELTLVLISTFIKNPYHRASYEKSIVKQRTPKRVDFPIKYKIYFMFRFKSNVKLN